MLKFFHSLSGGHEDVFCFWRVEEDHRTWSQRKLPLAHVIRRHLWKKRTFTIETRCKWMESPPFVHPQLRSTPTHPIPGCRCGCRCTAPGSVPSSPARTSKDACTTFWRGRLAGDASCITSQCEFLVFNFQNHPDPWGIQGHNCN